MGLFKKKDPLTELLGKNAKQEKIDRANTDLCFKGIEYQKQGDMQKAIDCYEELLARGFDGTHPYRSLCEYYHKQKMYDDEIRVIRTLKKNVPARAYKEQDKFRWYDKRLKELTTKK